MNKELSKAIMEKSKTRNKYLKWSSRDNYVPTKKAKKIFFKEATKDGISFGVLSNLF